MKRMAIITDVGFGLMDRNVPALWFTVHLSETNAAGQYFSGQRMLDLVIEAGYYNILELEGKPCWVELGDDSAKFLGLMKIK